MSELPSDCSHPHCHVQMLSVSIPSVEYMNRSSLFHCFYPYNSGKLHPWIGAGWTSVLKAGIRIIICYSECIKITVRVFRLFAIFVVACLPVELIFPAMCCQFSVRRVQYKSERDNKSFHCALQAIAYLIGTVQFSCIHEQCMGLKSQTSKSKLKIRWVLSN